MSQPRSAVQKERRSAGWNVRIVVILVCCIAFTSCAGLPDLRSFQDPRETAQYKRLIAAGGIADFDGCPSMLFRAGRPRQGENLLASLDPGPAREFKQQFFNCLGLLSRTPGLSLEIVGFADAAECTDDCEALSTRRAEVVRSALLQMHYPQVRISCAVGKGLDFPLVLDRHSDVGMNRRAELQVASSSMRKTGLPSACP
ncbi:hypothetical protein [Pseudoxanthomonas sp. UC19_8]|uniref:hypothetical protein n=1 Tax=Pseudoxanthomonas sp. UC19_8 TaxID=3350175 RepID=UPI0036D3B439